MNMKDIKSVINIRQSNIFNENESEYKKLKPSIEGFKVSKLT